MTIGITFWILLGIIFSPYMRTTALRSCGAGISQS
jgi:hypothetical protein